MTKQRNTSREPEIIYTKSFLDSPGSDQELQEVLLWWEMSLARRVLERLRSEGHSERHT